MPNISPDLLNLLTKTWDVNLGDFVFSPSYWQAALIIILLFFLVLSMAHYRRHLLDWSVKGAFFGIAFGFILALIIEGFLLIGGKTALIEVFGWKNPPAPIAKVLDLGRGQLIKVLGASDINLTLAGEKSTPNEFIDSYQAMTPQEQKKIKGLICSP